MNKYREDAIQKIVESLKEDYHSAVSSANMRLAKWKDIAQVTCGFSEEYLDNYFRSTAESMLDKALYQGALTNLHNGW